jgi:hypothetical protein
VNGSPLHMPLLERRLPELAELEELRGLVRGIGVVRQEATVACGALMLPIETFVIGPDDPTLPTFALVGGVHGLERIGIHVVLCFLRTLADLLHWDEGMQHLLERCRVVALPMVNPAGVLLRTRSNQNGVDLMRNAPIDADDRPNVRLVCGHRISPRLPWFRGHAGRPMEEEARALVGAIKREVFPSRFAVALDLHSGFGLMDRLWFPFAYSKRPYPRAAEMYGMRCRLERALPNHRYVIEPQSEQYMTHGDLWDHLWLEHRETQRDATFLPVTLEMGSWLWIKKNPRQLFFPTGIFNPLLPHRVQRTLRRHLGLLDFLLRLVASHRNWATREHLLRHACEERATKLWYDFKR